MSTAISTEVLTIGKINCALALAIAVAQLEQVQVQDEDPWAEQARAFEEQRACDCRDRELNPDMQRSYNTREWNHHGSSRW